ncbi:MAG: Rieske 2Fe-2S domain-containing protein [Acidobacteriaceae bacterium]
MIDPQVPFTSQSEQQSPSAQQSQSVEQPSAEQQQAPPIDEKLQKIVDKAFYANGSETAQSLRNFLNGTWLGEPLHAALTDVPLGSWTAAIIFDLIDSVRHNREWSAAADASVGLGVAAAAATAVTGLADWSDVDPPARRVGMIHGLLNIGATALFTTSFVLRKKRMRNRGRLFAALGYATVLYSAKLGGEMVYTHRVGVDRTNGQTLPEDFVAVLPESSLENDKPTHAEYNGVPILLVRRGERIFAIAETCSHFGAPLSEGKLEGDSIICPWHSSRFDLATGNVINGPAVHPQPCLEVRIQNGQVEVRKPPAPPSILG